MEHSSWIILKLRDEPNKTSFTLDEPQLIGVLKEKNRSIDLTRMKRFFYYLINYN